MKFSISVHCIQCNFIKMLQFLTADPNWLQVSEAKAQFEA